MNYIKHNFFNTFLFIIQQLFYLMGRLNNILKDIYTYSSLQIRHPS